MTSVCHNSWFASQPHILNQIFQNKDVAQQQNRHVLLKQKNRPLASVERNMRRESCLGLSLPSAPALPPQPFSPPAAPWAAICAPGATGPRTPLAAPRDPCPRWAVARSAAGCWRRCLGGRAPPGLRSACRSGAARAGCLSLCLPPAGTAGRTIKPLLTQRPYPKAALYGRLGLRTSHPKSHSDKPGDEQWVFHPVVGKHYPY